MPSRPADLYGYGDRLERAVARIRARYCARCGAVLDLSTAVAAQERPRDRDGKFSRLLRDKKVQEFLVKRMTDLGIA